MDFDQIIGNIKNKAYAPVYFLMGDEPYFIDCISDLIEDTVLEEDQKAFNQVIIYAESDTSVHDIVHQVRNFPMMANYLVVIVKEAQNIRNIEDLDQYLNDIPSTSILVLNYKYKKLDKRRALAKSIDKKGVLFESKKLYENNIPGWINNYLKEKAHKMTPKAMQMVADFLGTDLHKIKNELDKLIIAVPPTKTIDDVDVEYNIGISKDFNIFELQNAIGRRDVLKANQIINYFGNNSKDNPIIATIAILYGYFTKLLKVHYTKDPSRNSLDRVLGVSPFFVKDYLEAARNYNADTCRRAISVLREYDLYAKGYNCTDIPQNDLYQEMIFKIMH